MNSISGEARLQEGFIDGRGDRHVPYKGCRIVVGEQELYGCRRCPRPAFGLAPSRRMILAIRAEFTRGAPTASWPFVPSGTGRPPCPTDAANAIPFSVSSLRRLDDERHVCGGHARDFRYNYLHSDHPTPTDNWKYREQQRLRAIRRAGKKGRGDARQRAAGDRIRIQVGSATCEHAAGSRRRARRVPQAHRRLGPRRHRPAPDRLHRPLQPRADRRRDGARPDAGQVRAGRPGVGPRRSSPSTCSRASRCWTTCSTARSTSIARHEILDLRQHALRLEGRRAFRRRAGRKAPRRRA